MYSVGNTIIVKARIVDHESGVYQLEVGGSLVEDWFGEKHLELLENEADPIRAKIRLKASLEAQLEKIQKQLKEMEE